MPDDALLGVASFAARVSEDISFRPVSQHPEQLLLGAQSPQSRLFSDLDQALRYASATLPGEYQRQVVLISDGGGASEVATFGELLSVIPVENTKLEDLALSELIATRRRSTPDLARQRSFEPGLRVSVALGKPQARRKR